MPLPRPVLFAALAFSCAYAGVGVPASGAAPATPAMRPPADTAASSAIHVQLERDEEGVWRLYRNGQPYFIQGAGGLLHFDKLAAFGGNSIRTWGVSQLEARDDQGRNLLDRAHALGLSVTVGIWVQQARRGFDFSDPVAVNRQREQVRAAIRRYRDHPAVLAWGLGNEVEIARPGPNEALWRELNELAKIAKAEDPNHPVMTIIAGFAVEKLRSIMEFYPEIDILGINAYGSAPRITRVLSEVGWEKPWVLTEFGPPGPWEVPKTSWGAPIEPTAEEKAARYERAWVAAANPHDGRFLGGYAFNWGHKQEATSTWFGMFLPTGERTAATDVMHRLWKDAWPVDRVPVITNWSVPIARGEVAPGTEVEVSVEAEDPEGQPVTVTWWVMAETVKPGIGGDREEVPQTFADAITPLDATRALLRAPSTPGPYRLFVKAVDPSGGASVRNTPFLVTAP